MNASDTPLHVGVVLYQNPPDELERLGRSLGACRDWPDTPAFRIAFADNSPSRELLQTVAGICPEAAFEHVGRNLGFGAAHNRLMRSAFAAGARGYVCLNPDAMLHPSALAELIAEAARHPRPGLIEALQFPDEHPKPWDQRTHETPWASGCALLITRDLYETIGGFDENIFMYCEDVDLSWRARGAEFAVAVAPRALVHHYVGARAAGGHVQAQMLRSGAYLGRKYGNSQFAAACSAEHRALFGKVPELPPAPLVPPETAAVADFAHLFHFAPPRW